MPTKDRALLSLGLLLWAAQKPGARRWDTLAGDKLRELSAKDPTGTTVRTVLAGAAAFYMAERGKNPKVTSFYDALVYASTSLSVGHSSVVAQTPAGKVIGSALMTCGPALAARALDAPAGEARPAASEESVRLVAEKLDAILAELRAQRV